MDGCRGKQGVRAWIGAKAASSTCALHHTSHNMFFRRPALRALREPSTELAAWMDPSWTAQQPAASTAQPQRHTRTARASVVLTSRPYDTNPKSL